MDLDKLRFRIWLPDQNKFANTNIFAMLLAPEMPEQGFSVNVVQPIVIEQSSTLNDSSGSLIFEGDIIEISFETEVLSGGKRIKNTPMLLVYRAEENLSVNLA
jgi:YopX protein.